jgi:hypothetical protein
MLVNYFHIQKYKKIKSKSFILFIILKPFLSFSNVSVFGRLAGNGWAKSWRAFRSTSLSTCDEVY